MKVYDATSLRNVAIVGHGGCGKTQLVSTMLFVAGAVNRIGRVDDGTTITDFDEEEIARKHTLSSSLAYAEWQKIKINIIDTPGFANFLTDARAALRVVEAAVVVVDGVAGVEVQTEKLWAEAAALGLPRLVVVNRLDRDRASLERTLESLRRDCAREIVPVQLPLGEEKAFTQYFFPYKEIGPPQDATREVAVHLTADAGAVQAGVYSTAPREVRIRLRRGEEVALEVTEPMGMETLVYFGLNGTQVCGRVNPNAGARDGAPLRLAAHLDNMHLIDEATGRVI